jgi:hypothetical protein
VGITLIRGITRLAIAKQKVILRIRLNVTNLVGNCLSNIRDRGSDMDLNNAKYSVYISLPVHYPHISTRRGNKIDFQLIVF